MAWLGRPGLFASDLEICRGALCDGTGRARTVRAGNEKNRHVLILKKQGGILNESVNRPIQVLVLRCVFLFLFLFVCRMPVLV